ncbi:MAG: metalloregulator ArsR/SmtB family transcription factor [Chloroflexota bacterium]|jgi:ArsR family transcriptional regulator
MKSHRLYEIHAEICQALTHPIRLEIIDLLRDGEKGVSELVQELEAPQSTVSRHLGIMRAKGVVHARRDGGFTYYQLTSDRILTAYDAMHDFAAEIFAYQSELVSND